MQGETKSEELRLNTLNIFEYIFEDQQIKLHILVNFELILASPM